MTTRRGDRNDLHPEARSRLARVFVGLGMMLGGGLLGVVLSSDGELGLTEAVFAGVFMTWGGVLVDPKTFRAVLKEVVKASPWSNDDDSGRAG